MVDSFQRNSLWFSAVFSGKLVQKDVEILQWRAHSMPKRSSFCRGQGMSPKATFGPWLTLKALSVSSVAAELRFLKDISSSFFVPPTLASNCKCTEVFLSFCSFFLLYLWEMMHADSTYCSNCARIYVRQAVMLNTFNLRGDACQLYHNKTGRKRIKQ